MNLQLALIILGIVLIALIYVVSRHFDKKGHTSPIGAGYSNESNQNGDQGLAENDELVSQNAPMLDAEPLTPEHVSSPGENDTSRRDMHNDAQVLDDHFIEPKFESTFENDAEDQEDQGIDSQSEGLLSDGLVEVESDMQNIETPKGDSFASDGDDLSAEDLDLNPESSGRESAELSIKEPSTKEPSSILENTEQDLNVAIDDGMKVSGNDSVDVLKHKADDLDDIPELDLSDVVVDTSRIIDRKDVSGDDNVSAGDSRVVQEDPEDNIPSTEEVEVAETGWGIEGVTKSGDDEPHPDGVDEEDAVIDWGSIVSTNLDQSQTESDQEMPVMDESEIEKPSEYPEDDENNSALLLPSERSDSEEDFGAILSEIEENPNKVETSTPMNVSASSSPGDRIEPVFELINDPDESKEEILEEMLIEPEMDESLPVSRQVSEPNEIEDERADLNSQFDKPEMTEQDRQVAGMNSHHLDTVNYVYPEIEGFEKVSQIDYWVKIAGDRDVGRESVLAQYREAAARLGKPSRIYGMRLPDKGWCDLEMESEETRYADIVVTVQLADSRGAISESEMNNFTRLVSNLSEGTGRGFTFMAPVESALMQAQAIADFTRYYESIFVVNVRPQHSEYLDGASILRCATQLGLDQDSGQFFVRNKSVGKKKVCLYSLANMSDTGKFDFETIKDLRTKGVTFFTKPAVNRSPGAVFAEMVDTAKAFAARIKGEPSAPNFDDLSQDDIDSIRATIEKVCSEMEDLGMAPGSEEAMRVF